MFYAAAAGAVQERGAVAGLCASLQQPWQLPPGAHPTAAHMPDHLPFGFMPCAQDLPLLCMLVLLTLKKLKYCIEIPVVLSTGGNVCGDACAC